MRETKPSGVDWIGEIPSSWQVAPLKYGASCSSDLSTYTADDSKEYLALENVESWTGRLVGLDERPDSVDSSVSVFSETDVLFGKLRPYLAKVCRPDFRGVCSTELLCVSPMSYCCDYLFWLLISKGFIDVINAESYGVKMPRTSWAQMGAHYCPVPPLSEQQAIAGHLDAETAKIDQAMSLLRRELETLEQLKKSVIHEAVTKGLDPTVPMKPSGVEWIGDIPEHWEVQRLKFVLNNFDYLRMPVEASERSALGDILFPFYGASGIIDYIDRFNVEGESILVSEDGANLVSRSLPIAYLVEGRYWVNNHAHILRPKVGSMRYYFYALEACDYAPFVTGSAQPKLSQRNLNDVYIPVPPSPTEQEGIAVDLKRSLEDISRVFDLKRKQVDLLSQRRQSIIFEYVTGKRRVSEVA
mgnify:CR=1 FL=1